MTIREIAIKHGVSPASVSVVLNNRPGVRKELRREIQQTLLDNGYQIRKDTRPDGSVLFLHYQNPLFFSARNETILSPALNEVQRLCHEQNYRVIYQNVQKDTDSAWLSESDLHGIIGILVLGTELAIPPDQSQFHPNVPVVFMNFSSPEYRIDSVTVDYLLGAHLATDYLIKQGHREIAYFQDTYPADLRVRSHAFQMAFSNHGLAFNEDRLLPLSSERKKNHESVRYFLQKKTAAPTAIIADNDYIAVSAMLTIEQCDLRIPEDISIICCGDSSICQFATTPLTTIQWDFRAVANAAFHLLMDRIDQKAPSHALSISVSPQLVLRDSVQRNISRFMD